MKAKRTIIAALVAIMAIGANAQQVTTLYFLENAPMRHTINPAFQPVSQDSSISLRWDGCPSVEEITRSR